MLLDGGGGEPALELLDVGGDGDGLDGLEGQPAVLGPAEELADGLGVGQPGVGVGDVGGEEFEEAAGDPVAGVGDEGGDNEPVRVRSDPGQLGIRLACIHTLAPPLPLTFS